ncbi:MAG TPA: TetR family transcriptional regulator [Phenylobacterium sp.]|uniref:TetR/AcrR family transcriptional regulator n=1 Tax=Phenylobacterium conjunctum TaxID=1298959 RepID=A0ABW3T5A2_9CAUL|nr:TetR family transcriptional regulator [Phenylobacterium sp.]
MARAARAQQSPDEPPAQEERDGRRLRSIDSRARIVKAMLALIEEGDMAPGAEAVAARAEVGLRTVFRHFKDMESLYREMSDVMEAEISAFSRTPFKSTDWREKLQELVERRAFAFERITPFKRASDIHRYKSAFLDADNSRLVIALRKILQREMPPEVLQDAPLLEALDLLLSFESWSRLRREQGLSIKKAREVLSLAVAKVAS